MDKGADVDAVNGKGWSALSVAQGVFYPNTFKRIVRISALRVIHPPWKPTPPPPEQRAAPRGRFTASRRAGAVFGFAFALLALLTALVSFGPASLRRFFNALLWVDGAHIGPAPLRFPR